MFCLYLKHRTTCDLKNKPVFFPDEYIYFRPFDNMTQPVHKIVMSSMLSMFTLQFSNST